MYIVVAGSHCLDIEGKKESDPEWLVKQRETIVKIIEAWIAKYYQDVAVEAFTKHDYGKKIALKAQKTSHGGIAQQKGYPVEACQREREKNN